MAATIIAKDPQRYGFDVEYDEPLQFDVVEVNQPLELRKVAKMLGTSVAVLNELNPELRRGVTPPNYPGYQLRIPPGTKELFVQKFKTLDTKPGGLFVEHKVTRGQTLSYLSQRYGVPISAIMELNGLTNRHRLSIGQRLIIPTSRRMTDGGSKIQSRRRKKEKSGSFVYTVRKGDTLSKLAAKFNTTPEEIKRLNGLKNPHRINKGQKLRIPGAGASSSGLFREHRVKKGESVWSIAKKYGVSVSSIISVNAIKNKRLLKPGQRLLIPTTSDVTLQTYIVKKGDTLSGLALKFGTNPSEIKKLNGLNNPHYIKKGQKLKIPVKNGKGNHRSLNGRWITYVVKKGDTLWNIARAFGVLMEKLIQWNNLGAPSKLRVGDRIRIFLAD